MKPASIIGILVLVCCFISSSVGGYMAMSSSPAPEPQAEKVRGCTSPEATNYNASAEEDDGSCISKVMGCMDSMAANYSPDANEDDGSCVDYVFDKITDSYLTGRPERVDPNYRHLTFLNTCENKKDRELIDCALPQIKSCKDLCDEKDWCKGFTTSIWGEQDEALSDSGGMVCYFAKDDDEIEKFNETHPERSIGYIRA